MIVVTLDFIIYSPPDLLRCNLLTDELDDNSVLSLLRKSARLSGSMFKLGFYFEPILTKLGLL